MKKQIAITFILLTILIAGTVYLVNNNSNSALKNHQTYTKAICDESNFCQDNLVVCENKEIVSVTPITGAFVQFSEDWKDARTNTEISCD